MVKLDVFNRSLMNEGVYMFKCYEDSSLEYTGIDRHKGEDVGLYDIVLDSGQYEKLRESEDVSSTLEALSREGA